MEFGQNRNTDVTSLQKWLVHKTTHRTIDEGAASRVSPCLVRMCRRFDVDDSENLWVPGFDECESYVLTRESGAFSLLKLDKNGLFIPCYFEYY